jgi:hypothetical protein
MTEYESSLRILHEKTRSLFAENLDDGTKELLFENLIEQAYYTGQKDATSAVMEEMLHKMRKPL